MAIMYALGEYEKAYGTYPSGNSSEISQALLGANPQRLRWITFQKETISKDGEILDPWGTPYQFHISSKGPLIRSAGPNRVFDNGARTFDDYLWGW